MPASSLIDTGILLDEAGLYNAVKQGIAAVPGTRRFPDGVLNAGGERR